MNSNNFQGEQLWKTIWKILKTFVVSPTKIILPDVTGYIFQHTLINCIHSNAMNPFWTLKTREKVMISRYKLFILFARNFASSWQLFQRQIYSIRVRTGRFFNTDRLILFIAMQWTHFQSWYEGKKSCIVVTNF